MTLTESDIKQEHCNCSYKANQIKGHLNNHKLLFEAPGSS